MNSKTNNKVLIGTSLALALALAVWSPAQAGSDDTGDGAALTESQMAEHCNAMKAAKLKLREDVKSQDAQLSEQVAKMNLAPVDQKLGLMAALLTTIVDQKIAMDVRRAAGDDGMMHHMARHMQSGKSSMPCCSATKGPESPDAK